MEQLLKEPDAEKPDGQAFVATHWSVVLAASQEDPARRHQALETLCRTYWEPIYGWLRSSGYSVADAQDATQAFFAHLLERDSFANLRPEKGKFRSFLLKSLKHFLADEQDRANAAKRGNGRVCIPFDEQVAENRYLAEATLARTPEAAFDRRWALLLLNRAFQALQEEFLVSGKAEQLGVLAEFLAVEGGAEGYTVAASRLHMSVGAVAVAVHRLRARYRECIRGEVAQTVNSPVEIQEEMRYLLELLCQEAS